MAKLVFVIHGSRVIFHISLLLHVTGISVVVMGSVLESLAGIFPA